MNITTSIIDVVQGLRGEALRKAKLTGLYDKILKDQPPEQELIPDPINPNPVSLPPLPERFHTSKPVEPFGDIGDDIPW